MIDLTGYGERRRALDCGELAGPASTVCSRVNRCGGRFSLGWPLLSSYRPSFSSQFLCTSLSGCARPSGTRSSFPSCLAYSCCPLWRRGEARRTCSPSTSVKYRRVVWAARAGADRQGLAHVSRREFQRLEVRPRGCLPRVRRPFHPAGSATRQGVGQARVFRRPVARGHSRLRQGFVALIGLAALARATRTMLHPFTNGCLPRRRQRFSGRGWGLLWLGYSWPGWPFRPICDGPC